jgi:hypothetical protein
MANRIIPVTTDPSQQFTIDLDGQTVDLSIRWNATAQQWVMDFNALTFTTVINGLVLVTGVDLLGPYAVREIGQLWLVDLEEKNEEPTLSNFGDRFQLMYVEL